MVGRFFRFAVLAIGFVSVRPAEAAGLHPRKMSGLSTNARQVYESSMRLAAETFDPAVHLIKRPTESHSNAQGRFMVRESSWYALGLLMRDGDGDRMLAASILDTVLANQYRTPGTKWLGTFKRSPEEPEPGMGAVAFTEYDPNWRHFVGTTFEMILKEYPDRVPTELAQRMYASIDLAVRGEQEDGRLTPTYSNIALMYGALWDFAGAHDGDAAWRRGAAAWTEEVNRLFHVHESFAEYNSPTYYGVDLYGLALWRKYGSTGRVRAMGAGMEAALWTDVADYYQPALRNLAGPWDRSYGMDMESYVSVMGVWLRTVLEASQAPLPEKLTMGTDHVADLWFAPQIVMLGARIPARAMGRFQKFVGPHMVRRTIDDKRTATAWVGERAMWGAEAAGRSKDVGAGTQYHPVTVQWRTPSGAIGWISVIGAPGLDAVADRDGVTIETDGDVVFRLDAPGLEVGRIRQASWSLPGMEVGVETEAGYSLQGSALPQSPAGASVTYLKARHIRLMLRPMVR